ncbi:MAG TPA: Ig-like domain-containing protein [Cytophagaceae bacterium]|jgi:hypothetical protein
MNLPLVSLLSFFLIFTVGCKKDPVDNVSPIIQIISPRNNDEFSSADTIKIKISAEDNDRVSNLKITLLNSNQIPLFNCSRTDKNKVLNVDTIFVVQKDIHTVAGLKVEASDISQNNSVKNVYIHLNH